MINETSVKVPKKYQHMLQDLVRVTEVGSNAIQYRACAEDGYYFADTESHFANGDTQAEILSDIRTLTKCDCDECLNYWKSKR